MIGQFSASVEDLCPSPFVNGDVRVDYIPASPWQCLPAEYYLAGLIVALVLALGGCFLATNLFPSSPSAQKFKWGFFVSIACMVASLLAIGYLFYMREAYGSWSAWTPNWIWAFTLFTCSLGAFFQTRWGMVAMTILSLNPLIWLYNARYIHRRWGSLRPLTLRAPDPRFLVRTRHQRQALLVFVIGAALLFVQWMVAMGSGSGWYAISRCLNLRRIECGLGLNQTLLYLNLAWLTASACAVMFWMRWSKMLGRMRSWLAAGE